MTAQKFRKKPVVIEAMQWDGTAEGATPILDWALDEGGSITYRCDDPNGCGGVIKTHHLWVQTLEGGHIGSRGDWIVKGVQGEFYLVKESIFRQTYEPVEPQVVITFTEPRCMACGQLGHNCPTGGRLLR